MPARLRFGRQTSDDLDHSLGNFKESMRSLPPNGGWARSIRQALGMSGQQLARRVGVSRATIATLERSEARGRITLASLEKLARGLGCRVVYALVPEVSPSLSGLRRARARKLARTRLASAAGADATGHDAEHMRRQLERLTDELLAGSPRKLWE
jgi:predicted DNA-binding mobile mystery protein A